MDMDFMDLSAEILVICLCSRVSQGSPSITLYWYRRPLAFKECLTNIDFLQASKEDKLVPGFLGPNN